LIAALFPGQGFEEPGMARGVLDHPLIAEASNACGVDVRRALERWSPDLEQTRVLQPALVAVSLAAWESLDVRVDVVCGHSIGEISAWSASGAITARDAVILAARRGAAMQREADAHPGGMVTFDEREIEKTGDLDLAARNSPHRVVLSGDLGAIREMEKRGAKRLPVSGAWHSRLMRGATLDPIPAGKPTRTFVTCLDGSVVDRPDLDAQMTSPVRWDAVIASLVRLGVDAVIIPGPQKVMRALVRENAPELVA